MSVLIPNISHTNSFGRPVTTDVFSRLFDLGIIFIQGKITSELATNICAQLLCISHDRPNRPIRIIINSPGGEIYAALAIIDVMLHMKQVISTNVVGLAASAASLISAAGTPGYRKASSYASYMIHQPAGGVEGKTTDVQIYLKEMKRLHDLGSNFYSRFSGNKHTAEEFIKMMEQDKWMTSQEAKDIGLVDEILT